MCPRASSATQAPCRANALAVARPTPPLAPVTTTTDGFVLFIIGAGYPGPCTVNGLDRFTPASPIRVSVGGRTAPVRLVHPFRRLRAAAGIADPGRGGLACPGRRRGAVRAGENEGGTSMTTAPAAAGQLPAGVAAHAVRW
ncbi:hypothetical protein GCM10018779_14530 [Streptomyces griseocarneus]|nr:hypothetical protein GCM10018779_14530 [Streptomyces griseocarneus]